MSVHKSAKRITKQKWLVPLHHGDLLIMEHLQDAYAHALPKRLRVSQPRINVTLRRIQKG